MREAQTERPGLVNFAHCIVAFLTLIRVVLALRCRGAVLVLLRGPVLSLMVGIPVSSLCTQTDILIFNIVGAVRRRTQFFFEKCHEKNDPDNISNNKTKGLGSKLGNV